ncbi:MAG: repeat domain protein [Gemmatimonadetes bacterium]|nr:repeat domain protein [Gemmatimonadota bacterium]
MTFPYLRSAFVIALTALAGCSDAVTTPVQPDPPAPVLVSVQWASVSAGDQHTCGVSVQGAAYCWGRGGGGQLGTGTRDSTAVPTRVSGGVAFAQVAAGVTGTCARTAASEVYCWGDTGLTPRLVLASAGGVALLKAPGSYGYACGIQAGGALVCWNPSATASLAGPYRDAAPGADCLLDGDGHVLCAQHRLVGDDHPFAATRVNPTAGDPDAAFASVDGGGASACALRTDGAAFCTTRASSGCCLSAWVDNLTAVPGGHAFTQVSAAGLHACGLDAEHRVWCWELQTTSAGPSTTFQLGDPVQVAGLPPLTQISVGSAHACGATSAGDAYCWGSNQFGQLGTGSFGGTAAAPVKIPGAIS